VTKTSGGGGASACSAFFSQPVRPMRKAILSVSAKQDRGFIAWGNEKFGDRRHSKLLRIPALDLSWQSLVFSRAYQVGGNRPWDVSAIVGCNEREMSCLLTAVGSWTFSVELEFVDAKRVETR